MANLKVETLYVLEIHGLTKDDVKWVGCREYKVPTELFWKLADTEYDNSYGGQEVASDLVVCGDGWWMERRNYHGSERWFFKETLIEPSESRIITALTCHQSRNARRELSLEEYNDLDSDGEDY